MAANARQAFRDAFSLFDTDKSGDLDLAEVRVLLVAFGRDAACAEAVFATFDDDHSGTLDLEEANKMMQTLDTPGDAEAVREHQVQVSRMMREQKLPAARRVALKRQMAKSTAAVAQAVDDAAARDGGAVAETAQPIAAARERLSGPAQTMLVEAVVAAAASKVETSPSLSAEEARQRAIDVGVAVKVLRETLTAREEEIRELREQVITLEERLDERSALHRISAAAAATTSAAIARAAAPPLSNSHFVAALVASRPPMLAASSEPRAQSLISLRLRPKQQQQQQQQRSPAADPQGGNGGSIASSRNSVEHERRRAKLEGFLSTPPRSVDWGLFPKQQQQQQQHQHQHQHQLGSSALTPYSHRGASRLPKLLSTRTSPIRAPSSSVTTSATSTPALPAATGGVVAAAGRSATRFTSPCADDSEPEARAKLLAWMERGAAATAAATHSGGTPTASALPLSSPYLNAQRRRGAPGALAALRG